MTKTKCAAALLLCALLLSGCGQTPAAELPEPSFAEGEPHRYNRGVFRDWFQTMSSAAGPCTVSIQDKIYDEEQAADWWYIIQSDLAALNEALGLDEDAYSPFTVYIVENALNGSRVWNNYLYCNPEDILSGGYREGLVGAALGVDELWKEIGVAGSVFDGAEADTKQFTDYLTAVEDMDMLCLSVPYFVDAFASEEELSMARTAARLLCEHVISEHGIKMLVEDACIDCRQELLDELGIDRTYTDLYGGFDRGFLYRIHSEYPLSVTDERGDIFHIVPLPGDMETPAEVRRFLYEAWEGPQVLLEAVRTQAPEYADILAENYSAPFTCTLLPNQTASVAYPWGPTIKLTHSADIVHEMVHLFVPVPQILAADQWKYEACAQYFVFQYYPDRQSQAAYYDWLSTAARMPPEEWSSEANYQRAQKILEIYLAYSDFPQSEEDLDVLLFTKAMLAANYCLLSESELAEMRLSIAEAYQIAGIGNPIPEGGNRLSYEEAAAFADFLIQEYSLSAFLEYCLDGAATFEDIYGIDFETAETAWLEALMGM